MPDLAPPVPITEAHKISDFDCGKSPLNDFLKLHALAKQNAMLSRTYVVESHERVVAYYTLAHISVQSSNVPKKLGRGMPSAIPTMLMARLGIDLRHQGMGLGSSLFADAIRRTWATMASGPAPVRLFAVDAKDADAKRFYDRFDMIPSANDPMRLFLFYKTIRAIYEAPTT